MTKLTEKQCDILDQILGRFDSNGYLQREEIYQICDNNEKLASSYIEVLVSYRLVAKIGKTVDSDIPPILLKEPGAEIFIANGGFAQLHRNEKEESAQKKLAEENFKLQNENLNYSRTIREQEQRIRDLDEQNKFIEVIKNYWWLVAGLIALGMVLSKFLL